LRLPEKGICCCEPGNRGRPKNSALCEQSCHSEERRNAQRSPKSGPRPSLERRQHSESGEGGGIEVAQDRRHCCFHPFDYRECSTRTNFSIAFFNAARCFSTSSALPNLLRGARWVSTSGQGERWSCTDDIRSCPRCCAKVCNPQIPSSQGARAFRRARTNQGPPRCEPPARRTVEGWRSQTPP